MFSDKFKFEFEFIDPCLCNAWVATAVVGSSLIGAGATIYGANKGADAQKEAADKAIALQQNQYNQTRTDLSPFRDTGIDAAGRLKSRLTELTSPIIMDQAALENTPGYQFNLKQGMRGVTNSAAARGLSTSGAALKGAAAFATGLADSTYQNQFNNANTNQSNAYARLKGLIDTGENAAAQTGVLGEKAAYNSGVATVGAGVAEGAADNRSASAISKLTSDIGGYATYKGMYGNDIGSKPATGPGSPDAFTSNAYAISQGINPY